MPSVIDPLRQAFEWTKFVLFKPFNLGKWMVVGFTAFLAGLGEQSSWGRFDFPSGNSGGGGSAGTAQITEFLQEHAVIIAVISALVLLLIVSLGALVTWLSSRGKFMFLDNVVHNRAEVKAPWKAWAEIANNFFLFRFLLQMAGLVLVLGTIAGAAALAWPDLSSNSFGAPALTGLLVGGGLLVLVALVFGVLTVILKDFAVPVMYARRVTASAALGIFWSEILPGNFLTLVLFYLVKFGLGIAVGIVTLILCCLTFCTVLVPYLGVVMLLPIHVFLLSYNLFFLEQFGPQWRFFPEEPEEKLLGGPDAAWSGQERGEEGGWGELPQ